MMTTSEHEIQSKSLVAIGRHQCTVFRINTGKVKTADGRWFSSGTPKGYFDCSGFRWKDGKAFFIDFKSAKGKPRPDQIRFHKMLTSHNVIHGLAYSVDDAVKIVDEGLVGYGFKDYSNK